MIQWVVKSLRHQGPDGTVKEIKSLLTKQYKNLCDPTPKRASKWIRKILPPRVYCSPVAFAQFYNIDRALPEPMEPSTILKSLIKHRKTYSKSFVIQPNELNSWRDFLQRILVDEKVFSLEFNGL
jgi:hypothetical protein